MLFTRYLIMYVKSLYRFISKQIEIEPSLDLPSTQYNFALSHQPRHTQHVRIQLESTAITGSGTYLPRRWRPPAIQRRQSLPNRQDPRASLYLGCSGHILLPTIRSEVISIRLICFSPPCICFSVSHAHAVSVKLVIALPLRRCSS